MSETEWSDDSIDWTRLKTPELDSDIEDNDDVAAAKAKERRRRKVEKKRCEDEEKRAREEEEKRRREEEEQRRREEVERKLEEVQRKAAEANKKRQRDEGEAGPSAVPVSEPWCIRCAGTGVTCEFINDGNKRRTACKRCAAMREKCEWPEMDMSGPGKDKGKGKQVPTSPRQGEKKKRVRKAKAQVNDEVEIVGERMAGAGPSRVSLDRLVASDRGVERPDGGVGAGAKGVNTGALGLDAGALGVDAGAQGVDAGDQGRPGRPWKCLWTRPPFVVRRRSPRRSRQRKRLTKGR
ncbi:hypothetical protein BU15DRAFT_60651 [Melanogaster broomeanus]|nr:hypothetical protein BU15DRAFT_60651 [Melanogaster broomeanus]